MNERLIQRLILLSLALPIVICSLSDKEDDDDYLAEFRGFTEYETWKPAAEPSAPEVILIKQKDPHHHHMHDSMHSVSSVIKHNLPLLAVLAPLVAVALLLPLKAYLGPSYVIYPPVAEAPPAPPTKRVSKSDDENLIDEESLAAKVLNMIEKIDKAYGEMAAKDED